MAEFRKWHSHGSNLYGVGHPEDMPLLRGTTGDDVTAFVLEGRRRYFESIKDGGRDERDVTMLPTMPQYRKIRRIIGEYTFDGSEEGVAFTDSVGSMGDFRKKDKRFHLPYRCLYNKNFPNMFAAGRIISASGDGWEITRVIPTAALSGQAAGAAAALCVRDGAEAHRLDVGKLRGELEASGVLFR